MVTARILRFQKKKKMLIAFESPNTELTRLPKLLRLNIDKQSAVSGQIIVRRGQNYAVVADAFNVIVVFMVVVVCKVVVVRNVPHEAQQLRLRRRPTDRQPALKIRLRSR